MLRLAIVSSILGCSFLPTVLRGLRFRTQIFRLAGVKINGYPKIVGPQVIISPENLHIGDGAFINAGCIFESSGVITIGSQTHVGPRVLILTTNHTGQDLMTRVCESVRIGSSAWIGAGVTILPGVTVGDRAIVGAGSVVTKDVAPDSRVAGVPARPIQASAPDFR